MKELLDRMLEAHKFWTTVKGDKVVSAQHQFPCCEKYDKCCDDKESRKFWQNLQDLVEIWKPTKQPFRTKKVDLEFTEGSKEALEGW